MAGKLVLSEEKQVWLSGKVVCRPAKPWSNNVQALLGYLERHGFPAPHPLGVTGEGQEAVERVSCLEGEQVHPSIWKDDALHEIGAMAAKLHRLTAHFAVPEPGNWQPWCLRELGREPGERPRVLCHGNFAPWNVLTKNGMPAALIDWELAGPLDPLVELARICWLFPQLFDDDLQEKYGLPSPEERARQVRIICDGYGLPRIHRSTLVQQMLQVVICETAHEAIDRQITEHSVGPLWGFAWRNRSLYWMLRHRVVLERALQ